MKKKIRITFNAPLVLTFAMLCAAATLSRAVFGAAGTDRIFATYGASWGNPMTYLRLVTHVLGHTGWEHLLGNMSFILLLGPALEEKYGWKNLLGVILAAALATGLAHNLLLPRVYLMGASGVVFAFILLTSFTEFREGEIPLTFILVALIYLGEQVWEAAAVRDNVSNLSHILGGAVGSGAGYLLNERGKNRAGKA